MGFGVLALNCMFIGGVLTAPAFVKGLHDRELWTWAIAATEWGVCLIFVFIFMFILSGAKLQPEA